MSNILVIDHDNSSAGQLDNSLKKAGYTVSVVGRANAGIESLKTGVFDVVVVEFNQPEMNGYEITKELRRYGYKGHVLIVSDLKTTEDVIRGLDSGADHYVTKPFDMNELLARVRSMLRRKNADSLILKNGDLEMDLVGRTVSREGKRIELTTREFNLLEFLMRHRDKVVDRSAIARQVWGSEFDPDSNVIDVYINHLRKKIDSPFGLKLLKTVVGHGYVLNKID